MKSNEAERLLGIISDNLEQGKEFVVEQAPDVLQQLILLEKTESLLFLSVCVFLFTVCIKIFLKYKKFTAWEHNDITWEGVVIVLSGIALFFTTIATVFVVKNYLCVWIAPKVFIMEYLGNCLK